MNKTELITFLRDPNRLSSEQLEELEAIVNENPYFLSARLLLAKASKEQNHPQTKKRVASAAIYSTDRVLFKKYLNGNLLFLSGPPKPETAPEPATRGGSKPDKKEESVKTPIQQKEKQPIPESRVAPKSKPQSPVKETPKKPKATDAPVASSQEEKSPRVDKRPSAITKKPQKKQLKVSELPTGNLDSILEELQQDMANLKVSREKFTEVQKKIEEDDAVSAALEKASTKETPKTEVSTTPAPSVEPKVEDEQVETTKAETSDIAEAEKSASEITMQILEAAKKAKEEVALEDVAKEQKEEQEKVEAEEISSQPTGVEAKADTNVEESKADKKQEEEKDEPSDSGRAERVIREPRFSRFGSRSYLKPPEEIPEDFPDDDKDKPKEQKADQEKKKESSSEIKLPDLSKAKPVARRSRPKKKKSIKKDADTNTSKKDEVEAKATEDKPSENKKPAEKKTKTKKETARKTAEKKTTTRKSATTTKKEGTKSKSRTATKSKSETSKKDKKDDDKSDRKAQGDIIDKFIKESPTIKYQRKESTETKDLSEESSEWDPNLASEYLAEIYLHQGNKKRAIEIYEALSLKYPEKKSYLADLISKIE